MLFSVNIALHQIALGKAIYAKSVRTVSKTAILTREIIFNYFINKFLICFSMFLTVVIVALPN